MTPEQRQQLKAHVTEIARILHADAEDNQLEMETLGDIEETIRAQLQSHVSPDLALFLSTLAQSQTLERDASSKAS